MVRILVIGDLHGQIPKINFKNVDCILAPGDFCSDDIKPLIFETVKQFREGKKMVYWYEKLGKVKSRKALNKSLKDGRKVLEYLDSFGIPVFVVPGNWDWAYGVGFPWDSFNINHFKENLIKGLKNVKSIHKKKKSFKGVDFIGFGLSNGNDYPQYKADRDLLGEKSLKRIAKRKEKSITSLSKLFEKSKQTIIFLCHNVPFRTRLDKITDKKSPRCGQHFGSDIARDIIDKFQPKLCIGGHMHEHFGKCKVGKTTVLNTGFGKKVNTLIEIDNNKIKTLEFYPKEY